jgi:hypothetical protein
MPTALELENDRLRQRVARIENFLARSRQELTAPERARMDAARTHCDGVLALVGERAPDPNIGEGEIAYRARLLGKAARLTKRFETSRFDSCDVNSLDLMEKVVYPAAHESARNDAAGPGKLVAYTEGDGSGRQITKFTGDPLAWMGAFMSTGAHGSFNVE